MTKHKKTKQEKIIADLHRKLQSQSQKSPSISASHTHPQTPSLYSYNAKIAVSKKVTTTASLNNLVLIRHDILKTVIVTIAIVVSQILLLSLLKSHVIKIPFVTY